MTDDNFQAAQEQEKRDIAKADEEVLKRVLCGATDEKDFYYLTERLNPAFGLNCWLCIWR